LESEKSRLSHDYESLKTQMSQMETSYITFKRDLAKANEHLSASLGEQENLFSQIKENDLELERKSFDMSELEKSVLKYKAELKTAQLEMQDLRADLTMSHQQLKAIQEERARVILTNESLVKSNTEKEVSFQVFGFQFLRLIKLCRQCSPSLSPSSRTLNAVKRLKMNCRISSTLFFNLILRSAILIVLKSVKSMSLSRATMRESFSWNVRTWSVVRYLTGGLQEVLF
jgi:myosin heavy subunit